MKRILVLVCFLYIGMEILDGAGYCVDGDEMTTTACDLCTSLQNLQAPETVETVTPARDSTRTGLPLSESRPGRLSLKEFFHPPRA